MADPKRRGTFIAGNWKMYKGLGEARQLALDILRGLPPPGSLDGSIEGGHPRVGLFPNAVALAAVADAVRGREEEILVGAQNIYCEREGAFTGEISAGMVSSSGARGVILGHSERRHVFAESDELVGKKVERALEAGLTPVLCVGEKLDERERGETRDVVLRQLAAALEGVSEAKGLARIIFAYEPVWAIGTGKTATPAEGQEVHRLLRQEIARVFGRLSGESWRAEESLILYGGSVKPENALDLLSQPDIDGLLVGGASLKADSFLKICRAAT